MTQVALADLHPAHRRLRMLAGDLVFELPFIGDIARRAGHTLACQSDAERLLGDGAVVGVWPEGYKGIGKPFDQRYRLQRFGRGGFVSAALATGAPIVPTAIVGAEEASPTSNPSRALSGSRTSRSLRPFRCLARLASSRSPVGGASTSVSRLRLRTSRPTRCSSSNSPIGCAMRSSAPSTDC